MHEITWRLQSTESCLLEVRLGHTELKNQQSVLIMNHYALHCRKWTCEIYIKNGRCGFQYFTVKNTATFYVLGDWT